MISTLNAQNHGCHHDGEIKKDEADTYKALRCGVQHVANKFADP